MQMLLATGDAERSRLAVETVIASAAHDDGADGAAAVRDVE